MKVPFSTLLKFQIDAAYNDLTNFNESKNDQRKVDLLEFLLDYRKRCLKFHLCHRFLKLLVLFRIPVTDAIVAVHSIIDRQDILIEQVANELYVIHNQLKPAQLPPLDLLTAIDVLTTGSYRMLPSVVKVGQPNNK
jgi:hypothetical protein